MRVVIDLQELLKCWNNLLGSNQFILKVCCFRLTLNVYFQEISIPLPWKVFGLTRPIPPSPIPLEIPVLDHTFGLLDTSPLRISINPPCRWGEYGLFSGSTQFGKILRVCPPLKRPYKPNRTLRLSSHNVLAVVRFNLKTYGGHSFTVAALTNSLPLELQTCVCFKF